ENNRRIIEVSPRFPVSGVTCLRGGPRRTWRSHGPSSCADGSGCLGRSARGLASHRRDCGPFAQRLYDWRESALIRVASLLERVEYLDAWPPKILIVSRSHRQVMSSRDRSDITVFNRH